MEKEITIKYGNNSTADLIRLLKLEKEVYKDELNLSYQRGLQRFHKYSDFIVNAYDGDRFVGALVAYPITEEVYQKILSSDQLIDDDITADDIIPLSYKEVNHLFILDLVIDVEYRGLHISNKLHEGFWAIVNEKIKEGYMFSKIYAYAVTDAGEAVSKKNHREVIKKVMDGKYTLFAFDPAKFIDSTP